jgi:hypothetical protein
MQRGVDTVAQQVRLGFAQRAGRVAELNPHEQVLLAVGDADTLSGRTRKLAGRGAGQDCHVLHPFAGAAVERAADKVPELFIVGSGRGGSCHAWWAAEPTLTGKERGRASVG